MWLLLSNRISQRLIFSGTPLEIMYEFYFSGDACGHDAGKSETGSSCCLFY